jgi:hypothetical protein
MVRDVLGRCSVGEGGGAMTPRIPDWVGEVLMLLVGAVLLVVYVVAY